MRGIYGGGQGAAAGEMIDFSSDEPREILFEQRGPIGLVTLNRPERKNALTAEMYRRLSRKLEEWGLDRSVKAVVVRGAGGVFSSGGDLSRIFEAEAAGAEAQAEGREAMAVAYGVQRRVKLFPKPYVAFADGIAMGAGAGLLVNGQYSVGGDALSLAMPELAVGIVPDVGATFFLPRLPHHYGLHMGLTGARLDLADAMHAHLIDYYVRSERFETVIDQLVEADYSEGVDEMICEVLAMNSSAPGAPALKERLLEIEEAYEANSLLAIVNRLEAGSDWAKSQAAIIRRQSPTAAAIAFELLKQPAPDIEAALVAENRAVAFLAARPDFAEGIKAALIEKRAPNWLPATLEEVTRAAIAPAFGPPPGGDLRF